MPSDLRLPETRLVAHVDGAVVAETEVGHAALDADLADQDTAGIPYLHPVAAARVDVPLGVALDAVRPATVGVSEEALVHEEGAGQHDVEGVDVAGAGLVDGDVLAAVDGARVGDVDGFEVGREAEPVGSQEAVGDDADGVGVRLESVDLTGEDGVGADALVVAVGGVGEPDGAVVWMDDDVVDRVELSPVKGGDEGGALVWLFGLGNVDEASGVGLAALRTVEEAVFVVDAAVPHALWMVFGRGVFDAELGWVVMVVDTGDFDVFVGSGGVGLAGREGNLIGGYEDGVGGGVVDACFVKGLDGVGVLEQEVDGGVGAEEGVEVGVVGLEADES